MMRKKWTYSNELHPFLLLRALKKWGLLCFCLWSRFVLVTLTSWGQCMVGWGSPVDYYEMGGSSQRMENQSQWSWFHSDSLVSHSLTLDSTVEAETGLRPSLYQLRNVHPFKWFGFRRPLQRNESLTCVLNTIWSVMILHLQDLKEPFNLFHELLTVSSQTLRGAFLCCVGIIFPPTRLPLPDWLSVRCYHPILLNTSYLRVWMYSLPVIKPLL